jgi:hypothetical protein
VVEVITTTIILAIPLQLGEDNSQTKALIIMPQMAQGKSSLGSIQTRFGLV